MVSVNFSSSFPSPLPSSSLLLFVASLVSEQEIDMFCYLPKIIKLLPSILIIDGTFKQQARVPRESFHHHKLGGLDSSYVCSIRV